jgi:membrane protease YdiL (CAAX protease family)
MVISFFGRRKHGKTNIVISGIFVCWEVKTRLAFPTLLEAISSFGFPIVGVPIVYLLSKVLKIRAKPIAIAEPRKEAAFAVILSASLFVWAFAWWTLTLVFQLETSQLTVDLTFVAWMALFYAIGFLIVIALMKKTRQKLGTVGIDKNDIGRMVAFGLIIGAISFIIWGLLAPYFEGGFTGFSSSLVYALILTTMVGFSEEILFRGYVQTRLSAYGGRIKGLVFTSLLFAFWHFAADYYHVASGDVLATLAWCSVRVPFSLLFGYIMLKTQNIVPSAIFHLFYDWAIYVWGIS